MVPRLFRHCAFSPSLLAHKEPVHIMMEKTVTITNRRIGPSTARTLNQPTFYIICNHAEQ